MGDVRPNLPAVSAARSILILLRAVRATGLPLNILFLPATITALVCTSNMNFRETFLFGGDSFPYEILTSHVFEPLHAHVFPLASRAHSFVAVTWMCLELGLLPG